MIDAQLLFTSLTPRTMALMIADIEETACTGQSEALVNLIYRNGEANCGDEFPVLVEAARAGNL